MRVRIVAPGIILLLLLGATGLAAGEWSSWRTIYGSREEIGGGIDVRFKRDGGLYVSYLMEFRNRYDKSANIKFTYVDANGEQRKGWTYARAKSTSSASCNRCDEQPVIENLTVQFR